MSDDYTPPTPTQVETVVGALDDGTEISIIMRAFYPLLLERAWERAGQQVQLGTAFDLRNPRVQETIAGLAQRVRRARSPLARIWRMRCRTCCHPTAPRDLRRRHGL